MSSLRNAVKRITHKERSQPSHRKHLGNLEKKSDYKLRADNFRQKKDRRRALVRKAANKNPDEYYHEMHNARIVNGSHQMTRAARMERYKDTIGPEAVRVMKGQDLAYVRMVAARDRKTVEKLRSGLHLIGGGGGEEEEDVTRKKMERKHTIFVDEDEVAAATRDDGAFDVAAHFGTDPRLMGRAYNRPRIETLVSKASRDGEENAAREEEEEKGEWKVVATPKSRKKAERQRRKREEAAKELLVETAKARAASYNEFEARKKRLEDLSVAESHLVTEKLVQGKGTKRKIKEAEDGKPPVYIWKRKRAK